MNGSTLVFGSNKNSRKEKILDIVNKSLKKDFESSELYKNPDIKVVKVEEGSKSIGIAEMREAISFLQQKPFFLKQKFLIILDGEKLTLQAQNSLLKTLEEPPAYANIILTSKLQNSLLETVVSRCRQIPVKGESNEKIEFKPLKDITKMSLGERLDFAQEISKEEKEDIINILEEWVIEERKRMIKAPNNPHYLKNIKKIIKIKKDIEETNINLRLSLETLLLSLSKD